MSVVIGIEWAELLFRCAEYDLVDAFSSAGLF